MVLSTKQITFAQMTTMRKSSKMIPISWHGAAQTEKRTRGWGGTLAHHARTTRTRSETGKQEGARERDALFSGTTFDLSLISRSMASAGL